MFEYFDSSSIIDLSTGRDDASAKVMMALGTFSLRTFKVSNGDEYEGEWEKNNQTGNGTLKSK